MRQRWGDMQGVGCHRSVCRVGLVILLLAGVTCFAGTAGAQGKSNAADRLADAPWPRYRRDAVQSGRSDHNGPQSARVMWTFSTGKRQAEGGIETDATIGADGTVYVGANNGMFYALDGRSGDIKWVFPTAFETHAIYSTAAVDRAGRVYFGAKDGYLYVLLPPQRGILARLAWRYRIGTTIETSPALGADGTVYIGADNGKLYAIAPPRQGEQGRLRWTLQTGNTLVASSPAIAPDGTVYIGSLDGKLYAVQPPPPGSPPRLRWTFSTGSAWDKGGIENSPALGPDGTVYIGANNGIFYALDGRSGKVKWQVQTEFRTWGIFSSAALGKDGTVYVGPKDGRLLALDGKTGKLKWSYPIGTTIETSPLITPDGTVYLGADNGKLYAIRPPGFLRRTGRLKWSYPTQGTLIASPVIGPGGSLYIGSMDGTLYAFGAAALGATRRNGPLSGTWYGAYQDSGSAGGITFVLRQQGQTVHGVWRLQGGRRGVLRGQVSGDRATFSLTPMSAACPGTGEGTATIMADKLSGEYRGQHCMGEITHGVFSVQR